MNIYDYLKFYKEKSVTEINWNMMDNLVLSILAYLPISSFLSSKSLSELVSYAECFSENDMPGVMSPFACKILKLINKSKRYKNMVISDFINIRNDKTQFGAMCVSLGNIKTIAFKGSDGTFISWLENIRMSYMDKTYTDTLAHKYLEKHITMKKEKIFVTGHSKGGHLALMSSLLLKKNKLAKINKIYNFDGPGVLKEIYNSQNYEILKTKLVNIVPTGSVVGVCLYNDEYQVVKSSNLAFNEHYPFSWQIFGEFFIPGNLSLLSRQLHENTTVNLDCLDRETLKNTIEEISIKLCDNVTRPIQFDIIKLKETIKNMPSIDADVYKYLIKALETVLSISKNNQDDL